MKILNDTKYFVALLAVTSVLNAGAADSPAASPSLPVLSTVTKAELPAKAAALVSQAAAKARPQATADIVKSAVGLNPAAAPAIVGSIAQRTPEMASVAAATAVGLVPDQAVAIARVAAAAAPAKAGQIVEAICRVIPASYEKVAMAVAEVVPGADRQILKGVCAAVPSLNNSINEILAASGKNTYSVSSILTQISSTEDGAAVTQPASQVPAMQARGPSPGAPFVPLSGTPTVTTPGDGGVTPAPVNYSAP